jgi:two-component system nitrogen regulation sensor histidine kinase NtrY
MNVFIKKNKYLLLFVLFILIATLVSVTNLSYQYDSPDVQGVTHKLRNKEQIVDITIDSLLANVQNKQLNTYINKNAGRFDYLHREKGLVFLVYQNSNLVYWSSNSVALPNGSVWHENQFSKIGNSYVAIRKKQGNDISVVGLIDIMDSYPYQNKFLSNGFHKSFKLDDTYSLIIENKNAENAIKNVNNEYLFSLTKEKKNNELAKNNALVVLILLAFVFLLMYGRDKFSKSDFTTQQYAVFALVLVGFRAVIQVIGFPSFLYSMKIFQAQYFAYSNIFPSLGELLISTILITYLIFVFYTKVKLSSFEHKNSKLKAAILIAWIVIIACYSYLANGIFKHLIIDSNFQFEAYDVLNLSVFSFIGYFILLILFIGIILLVDKACIQIKGAVTVKQVIIGLAGTAFAVVLNLFMLGKYQYIFPTVFYVLVLSYWVYVRLVHTPRFGMVVLLIALFSAFSTYFIRKQNFTKRIDESKVLAVNLAREQDPVAEVVLSDVIETIRTDTAIITYLESDLFKFDEMSVYITKKYFTGYLKRYDMQLLKCNKYDSVLLDENLQLWQHCYGFFNNLLQSDGVETDIPGLYYLKNPSGGLNYFMRIGIELSNNWEDETLFFELVSRPNIKVLGYPELLLDKSVGLFDNQNNASIAKYNNNQIVSRSGDFPYALDRNVYEGFDTEYFFFQQEGYDHLLFNYQEKQTVIISYPTVHFYNIIISFTYIFFFLLIQTTLLLIVGNRFTPIIDFQFNIKNKIVFSMILILLISLFFVGGGTIMYTYDRFEKEQIDILSDKIQSVLVELEHKFSEYYDIHDISPEYVNSLLVKFSNVFYSDINLYDLKGNLVGTSRKEIFDRNLTGNKINAIAYRELFLNKKARVVHKEHIGSMEYYSAYVPFINSENQLLAYINLPYFSKEVVLRQELLRVVVAVINIYAFLLVLSIIVAVYISSRLTEPLRMVQQRIRNIDLSQKNEKIDYDGQDEIAELVFEYNRMLGELDKSAKLLARSERESAWREMARQIAHEIKNPLTPMKLSIQLLDQSLKNNDADFKERFERSTKTLIDQIDSLSSIASTFSQFAIMPKTKIAKVDLIDRINRSAELFKDFSKVTLETNYENSSSIYVKADSDRMLQVFNNLMKNAIQSIPHNKNGKVVLNISQSDNNVVVEVRDNGAGINPEMDDMLFQPNFTTKSSGMGLGLAIVKNIVEEFGGTIWFKSELGKGTSFFVSFPIYSDIEPQ